MSFMIKDDLTVKELEALPDNAVALDCENDAWQKYEGEWYAYGVEPIESSDLTDWEPIALIWEGE